MDATHVNATIHPFAGETFFPHDIEYWEGPRYELTGRLRTEVRRGYVTRFGPIYALGAGQACTFVRRLRPYPHPWRRWVLVGAVVLIVGGVAIWLLSHVLLAVAVMVGGWLAVRRVAGHRPTCAGLHCRGCSG